MPMFFSHTPTHSSTVRECINASKLADYKKPIGPIGQSLYCSYGFDGDDYYVEVGLLPYLAFGRMKLDFNQAKAAYDAILFFEIDSKKWDVDGAKKALREARKSKLSGDDLMFFFGDRFEEFVIN